MKAALITSFVLAVSFTVMVNSAHGVTVEPPAEPVEGQTSSSPEDGKIEIDGERYDPNLMGLQKGYASIQFHVFGFERSLTDLATKLGLGIEYRLTEDGWFQDRAEYTVTGKVSNVAKFYKTIGTLTEKFQLEKDPLVITGDSQAPELKL